MTSEGWIQLAAIILSPIVAIGIGELLRKWSFRKNRRLEILYDLIAYRHDVSHEKFISALNSLKLFYNDQILRGLLFELTETFNATRYGKAANGMADVLIIKIMKRVCGLEGFQSLSEEDLNSLFQVERRIPNP